LLDGSYSYSTERPTETFNADTYSDNAQDSNVFMHANRRKEYSRSEFNKRNIAEA